MIPKFRASIKALLILGFGGVFSTIDADESAPFAPKAMRGVSVSDDYLKMGEYPRGDGSPSQIVWECDMAEMYGWMAMGLGTFVILVLITIWEKPRDDKYNPLPPRSRLDSTKER